VHGTEELAALLLPAYFRRTIMDIGLGLPISDPALLLEWARRADAGPFRTLALLDRLVFDNPEPLITLATLAGATGRIGLQTEVLLGPLRATALLAKQVATLDRMSGGRFTLGIGVGGRHDDFAAAGVPLNTRGRALDTQLAELRAIWRGDAFPTGGDEPAGGPIGPRPLRPAGPPILIGAFAPAALERVARHGDGFLCAAPLAWAAQPIEAVRRHWKDRGRAGSPRIVAQVNVAAGPPAVLDDATRAIRAYYAFTGRDDWGAPMTDPKQISQAIAGYGDLGADEVVLYCYGRDPDQVDRLADLVP
jgi:alkanesulfonate monooxygenase SsuD/methylene tetrahydromethanopterin reductase-like flavin-dependent oxidoreductase (luciferase family)